MILFKIIMIDHPMDYNEDIVSATEDIENLSEQTEKLLWFRRGVEGWGFIAQGAIGEELTARAQTFRGDLEKVLKNIKIWDILEELEVRWGGSVRLKNPTMMQTEPLQSVFQEA